MSEQQGWKVDAVSVLDEIRSMGHGALVDVAILAIRNRELEAEVAELRSRLSEG